MNKVIGILILLGAAAPLLAAPPVAGRPGPGGPTCRVNAAEAQRRAAVLRAAKTFGAPLAPPVPSNPHVLVIRVEFNGTPLSTSLAATQNTFSFMRDFYMENSYGVFQPTFTITSVFTLPGTEATYGNDCGGDVTCNVQTLFNDVKSTAQPTIVDFSSYDHVMIYHAGTGQESTGVSSDLWSLYIPGLQTLGVTPFQGFTIVPEDEITVDPLGVMCHEYGHQLGLPDLYDVSVAGGKTTLGSWDLMDYPYGSTPADTPHFGAWSKKFLGFGVNQTSTGTVAFPPSETTSTGTLRLGAGTDYFLMEYRKRGAGSFDGALPPSGGVFAGLGFWHIDDAIALNPVRLANNDVNSPSASGQGHRGVDLVEADGTPAGADLGNNNGFVNGQIIASPQTDLYGGVPSGITVTNISGVGAAVAMADVQSIQTAATVQVAKAVSYPNPGGDPAKYPVRPGAAPGTVTTLFIQLGRPVSSDQLSLDIYTQAGERVRSVPSGQLTLNSAKTADLKWVYEYDWNGKNDDGADVASGVYFYRVKAKDDFVKGKLAILR